MSNMTMKALVMGVAMSLAGAALAQDAATDTPPTSRKAAAAEWSVDGLQQVKVEGLDLVYMAPGASLQGYSQVMIDPISVGFSRSFERSTRPGSHLRWSSKDMQRIRERLTTTLVEESGKVLTEGGYAVVNATGEGVLRVDLKITNLNIAAPLASEQMSTRIYSVSAGEMTLVAELSDSVSGEVLARVYDFAEARESSAHRITNAENASEARNIARSWAQILLAQLNGAKQQQP